MSDNEYPDEYLDENGNEYQEEKPEQERGELKPCPFCGTLPQANAWIFRGISETRYFCPNQECPLSVRTVTLEEWNTRPIEDALKARIVELEKLVDELKPYRDGYDAYENPPEEGENVVANLGSWLFLAQHRGDKWYDSLGVQAEIRGGVERWWKLPEVTE